MTKPTEPLLTPKLIVTNASQAIAFYKSAFGATEHERYTTPQGVVVHASVLINGAVVLVVDAVPDWGNVAPEGLGGSPVIMTLSVDDPDKTAADAQAAGAEILIPVADQFYGRREGRLRDPFGHLWIVGKEVRQMTPAQIQKGVDEFGSA